MNKIRNIGVGVLSWAVLSIGSPSLAHAESFFDSIFQPSKPSESDFPDLFPGKPVSREPRTLSQCSVVLKDDTGSTELSMRVIKQNGLRSGWLQEKRDGASREYSMIYVHSQHFRKEMLGQYAAAVDVAHFLGITQLDSIRVYFVDPDPRLPRTIIEFLDEDGEILDRFGSSGDRWKRCL